jgi:hypothetical protein
MRFLSDSLRRHVSQIAMIIALIMLLTAIILANGPAHGQSTQPAATHSAVGTSQATSSQETIAPSPTPERITNDPNEANGIIFGGVLMVMIVVIGTLSVIRKKSSSDQ